MNDKKLHSHHGHTHNEPHIWCVATIVYNILVVLIELVLQLLLTDHDSQELASFEIQVQVFHFVGMIILGIVQYWIMHKIKKQTTLKFAGVSMFMVAVHMIVLHLIPRLWGVVHMHHGEISEVFTLIGIVVFVSLLFWFRDNILHSSGLKNKRIIDMRKIKFPL